MTEARYSRNMTALSADECKIIQRSCVGVVGCGGLGGYVIDQLVRIGVGRLVTIDGDVFEETNLNRQLLCRECDLGTPKAQRAAEYAIAINSHIEAAPHVVFLDDGNAPALLSGCDCVVDALDSGAGKLMLSRACSRLGTPLVHGAIAGWYGQVAVVRPGDNIIETLYAAEPDSSIHHELGNLAPTCACTAAHMAAETIKLLIGRPTIPPDTLLMLNLLDEEYSTVP